jgi:hypothetical protein
MRTLGSIIAIVLFGTTPATAQSKWLESGRLDPSEVSTLCQRASDIRLLARIQMITTGNERWLRLSRQELVVEAFVMGTPPLDPRRCYVLARAGLAEETERRVFEVCDFAVSSESTTVFVVGRNFALPAESAELVGEQSVRRDGLQ